MSSAVEKAVPLYERWSRAIHLLRYEQEMSQGAIARHLGVSRFVIRYALNPERARRQAREGTDRYSKTEKGRTTRARYERSPKRQLYLEVRNLSRILKEDELGR